MAAYFVNSSLPTRTVCKELSKSLVPDVLKKVLKEMKVESIYGAFSVNE